MTTKAQDTRLAEALSVLVDLELPRAQRNERTALCLLALLNLTPDKAWSRAESPLVGITPIMDWSKQSYDKDYAPNTRETFRRQSMHQFMQAGICLYNPDNPKRPVNSPSAVYQITPELLAVLKTFGTSAYGPAMRAFKKQRGTLAERYAKAREMVQIPVVIKEGVEIRLSAGSHSELIKQIIEEFVSRYAPGGELVYVGDTGDKHGYFDAPLLTELGVNLDNHGKFPDVVVYYRERNWLLLIESVTSHGPVDYKRRAELEELFDGCKAGLVYVSAFPDRKVFLKYLDQIAWETEVWVAATPTHMVHFNGSRFLGPYGE